ncbi:dihydropyrimidine dehydrogenase [Sporanaerobium hydrogeniformans]|uniref:Dihydropyrimidine dehydrogenase n=1 Tax=Sporanaerobium hydrogeniformans TaxID=3072179 RepID=A0AC61DCM6_9FIRM|nr:NAD(P)-dependent oxidoreductase [Sporanaerobium hydrogeniformans]PHV71074.1 dihydropyrimidine dehydrogenase [Sporanaerobium hydrogeniformans]
MINLSTEANRCLKCKNARCQIHCPIRTPIPEIIHLFQEGQIHEAGELLFNNNPLSAICAIVCPHEHQCKGACIKGIKGEPVAFHTIEEFISKRYLEELTITRAPKNGFKIAIVGSGPAGLTIAITLAQKGYDITLFEMRDRIGGVLTYGIPEFRLPRTLIEQLEQKLLQLGVKIKHNTLVGPIITLDKLLFDGYNAIFIGTGVWNPKTLGIKGETLGNALYAIDYLKNPSTYHLGEKVCVIGAGNVAMDAARSAKYYGASEVTICYRRGEETMTATQAEITHTKQDGVHFNFYKTPLEITDKGIILADTREVLQEDGSFVLEQILHSEKLFTCDTIIIAISQVPQTNIVSTSSSLQTRYGLLVTDEVGHTTKEGVFACGDVVSGAKTVIDAVVAAKRVAHAIDCYCQKQSTP